MSNAQRDERRIRKMERNKRNFWQIMHDMFEDGVFAFAMAYAGAKSDYAKVRSFEDKLL